MGAVPSHILLPTANEVTEGPYDLRALRCEQRAKKFGSGTALWCKMCLAYLQCFQGSLCYVQLTRQNNAQGATVDWMGAAVGHLAAGLHVTGRALLGQIDA